MQYHTTQPLLLRRQITTRARPHRLAVEYHSLRIPLTELTQNILIHGIDIPIRRGLVRNPTRFPKPRIIVDHDIGVERVGEYDLNRKHGSDIGRVPVANEDCQGRRLMGGWDAVGDGGHVDAAGRREFESVNGIRIVGRDLETGVE